MVVLVVALLLRPL